jgi:hypothetical protein
LKHRGTEEAEGVGKIGIGPTGDRKPGFDYTITKTTQLPIPIRGQRNKRQPYVFSPCLRGGLHPQLAEKSPRVDNLYAFKTGEDQMPKYVIEREIPGAGNLKPEELQAISQ